MDAGGTCRVRTCSLAVMSRRRCQLRQCPLFAPPGVRRMPVMAPRITGCKVFVSQSGEQVLPLVACFALPIFTGTASGHGLKPGSAAAAYGPRHIRRSPAIRPKTLAADAGVEPASSRLLPLCVRASICHGAPCRIFTGHPVLWW